MKSISRSSPQEHPIKKSVKNRSEMAATVMSSLNLKPSSPLVAVKGLPSLPTKTPFRVYASGGKKIKTDKPYGVNGGMALREGLDASGRKPKGKGVYQFVDKYGANVDGYSPIYNEDEWSPSGDVYVGGTTGLLIWGVTLAGILGGGALLVYSTSALAQ
ncbi:hypothetical protein L1987_07970 [Smallanthus sonchifolius]|uniref:Uncharacterized protein n=1 Tax=Smallanthus sonchifolius TaxID=185202 RepID=A0ACB9JKF3_9ASTR|nr:hypothetical protein L1987_07970 [Smallanthus sonchifolius]